MISEVVPLTRRQPVRGKSGLSNEMSSSYDGVSDSGYSSTNAGTPNNETPPLKSTTPAPINTPSPKVQKDAFKRASTPGIQRPSSKAFNRTASPAVPRNIPGAKPRERSPTMPSTGGADECDCADCKKDVASKGSPSSPSVLSSGVSGSYHGSYSHSPSSWTGYQYPPCRYDGYDSGLMESPREEKKKSSMPPPPRPSSTFSGATSSSYSAAYGNYFAHSASPAPAPPTPSSTCPPTAFSAYAPPPLNPSSPGPTAYSHYGPSSSMPPYGSPYDGYSASPSSSYPDSYMPPPPSLGSGRESSSKRRNSMRAQANSGAAYEFDDHIPQRRSSRAGERPPSWLPSHRDLDGIDRSLSVPPGTSVPPEAIRRKTTTPGPAPRRRESAHAQGTSGRLSLGPSALSRAMESCAISDDPPVRSHSRSHSDYYSHGHSHQLARRDPGTLMHPVDFSSSRSHGIHPDELVQMSLPDSDGDTFTMRYPAGIPVKLQLNGGTHKTISLGPKKKGDIEQSVAYRYVQQRQQQVHAQLQYGAKTAAGDYAHRPSRRATMSGSAAY